MPLTTNKLIGVALFLCLALPAQAAIITAGGSGSVMATPDQARLTAGVATSGATAAIALSANRAAMTRVFAALKGLNVPDSAIRTTTFNLTPQYAPNVPGQPVQQRQTVGYNVTDQVMVTLDDPTRVGTVLDALVAAGANQASNVTFSLHDPSALQNQAREAAVKDAIARAQIYARVAGVALGALASVTDTPAQQRITDLVAPAFQTAVVTSPINAGQLTVTATVWVTYEAK